MSTLNTNWWAASPTPFLRWWGWVFCGCAWRSYTNSNKCVTLDFSVTTNPQYHGSITRTRRLLHCEIAPQSSGAALVNTANIPTNANIYQGAGKYNAVHSFPLFRDQEGMALHHWHWTPHHIQPKIHITEPGILDGICLFTAILCLRFPCCRWSLPYWTSGNEYREQGSSLAKLAPICWVSGSGSSLLENQTQAPNTIPLRLCSSHPNLLLGSRIIDLSWISITSTFCHWYADLHSLWEIPSGSKTQRILHHGYPKQWMDG